MSLLRQRIWIAYLIAGSGAIAAFFIVGPGMVQNSIYDALALLVVAAIIVGVRVHRIPNAGAWYALAAAHVLISVGNVTYDYYEFALHQESPFPSLADVGFLLGYAALAIGLALLVRSRGQKGDRYGLIDATIVATGVGLIAWIYLMQPYASEAGVPWLEKATSIAYPVTDVLLLALIVRLLIGFHQRSATNLFLLASLGFTLAADASYAWAELADVYTDGMWLDGGWLIAFVLFAVAALHPSAGRTPVQARLETRRPWLRLMLLAAASLLAPTAMVIQTVREEHHDQLVLAAAAAVLFLLVVVRMNGLVREVQKKAAELVVQREALEIAQAEKSSLIARLLEVTEQDRKQLAAEIHDGPIQRLTSVDLSLHTLKRRVSLDDDASHTTIGQLEDRTRMTIGELRVMMNQLHPPALKERGLEAALSDYLSEVSESSGLQGSLSCALPERLRPELETTIFRVVQEAVANSAKHSGAGRVSVTVRTENGCINLEVVDDGKGFVPNTTHDSNGMHYGLVAMRERVEMMNGTWELRSTPRTGTRVSARLPREIGGA